MVCQGQGNPSLHPNTPKCASCYIQRVHFGGYTSLLRAWATCTSTPPPTHPPVSGLVSSKIRTIPWPCLSVHIFMGEPPPMRLYCFWILGVLLRAIHGPRELQGRRVKAKDHTSMGVGLHTSVQGEE